MNNLRTFFLTGTIALGAFTGLAGVAAAEVQNIDLVHGGNVDASTWREVYDRLITQGFNVTISQMPMTSPNEVADVIAQAARSVE